MTPDLKYLRHGGHIQVVSGIAQKQIVLLILPSATLLHEPSGQPCQNMSDFVEYLLGDQRQLVAGQGRTVAANDIL